MQWLKDIINKIANSIGLNPWVVAIVGLALIILIAAAIVFAIVFAVRKKAKKQQASEPVKEQEETPEEVKQEEVKEEIKEETPAPAEVEEEKPIEAVEPVKEETQEEPKTEEKQKKENNDKEATTMKTTKQATKKQETKAAPKAEKAKADRTAAKATVAEKPKATKSTIAKTAAAKTAAKPEVSSKPATKAKVLGKWAIEKKSEDEFLALLFASNGEVMLTSETYSTEDGARKGIATIIKAVGNGEFVVHKNKNGTFYFKLKSSGNRLLCAGEIYKDKTSCENAIESVKRIAADSPITEAVLEGEKYIEYTPVKLTEEDIKKAISGKWKIETTEDGKFYATLYASNGQIMLSTEEVATKISANAGIENAKKNALAGNFVIDKDKFGKFYYKLRNANKSVICIGESYAKEESCISALESVRKLAAKSPIVE